MAKAKSSSYPLPLSDPNASHGNTASPYNTGLRQLPLQDPNASHGNAGTPYATGTTPQYGTGVHTAPLPGTDPYAPSQPTYGQSGVPSLASSPAYQAYLRELGLSEADASNDEQFRESLLKRQLEPGSAYMAQLNQQGALQREHILGGMEARGVLRSGETEHAMSMQRTSEGAQRSALQGEINDQIAMLQHNLAQQLAGIARQRATGTLSSATGIYGQ